MDKSETVLWSCSEAAKYLGFNEARIRYEVFVGRIPHLKIGRSVRFTKAQLDAWIEKSAQVVLKK